MKEKGLDRIEDPLYNRTESPKGQVGITGFIFIDAQVGEFYLSEEDEIEARDVKLAEALNTHLHGGGWKKVSAVQAVGMLLAVNRPVRNSGQDAPVSNA
jgi:hypothetical protein